MAGVYKLEIRETEEELKFLLGQQKKAQSRERVQLLYWLKKEQVKTVQEAANLLGRNRVTVQKWMKIYREGGIKALLAEKKSTGRPQVIPKWAQTALDQRLQEPEGFESYQAICDWLEQTLGVKATYKTVHKLVHYRLQLSSKVSRHMSQKQG